MSIIFRQVEEIRSGRKTQTRRVCKPDHSLENGPAVRCPGVYVWRPEIDYLRKHWIIGQEYAAVPKMYHPAFGRVRITAILQERLHDITEADAIAEGVASVAEYRDLWESINGKTKGARWADNPLVWVLSFEYVGDAEQK